VLVLFYSPYQLKAGEWAYFGCRSGKGMALNSRKRCSLGRGGGSQERKLRFYPLCMKGVKSESKLEYDYSEDDLR